MKLRLVFTDEQGAEQQALVTARSYSIGRHASNDLVLADPSLSRRHALITCFEEMAQITDCGSQNGTFVNGHQIRGATDIKSGDVILLGESCQLRVQLGRDHPATSPAGAQPAARGNANVTVRRAVSGRGFSLSAPIAIAALSIGSILLVGSGLIAYLLLRPLPKTEQPERLELRSPAPVPHSPTPPPASPPVGAPEGGIEKLAIQVMQKISLEQTYAFRPNVQAELQQRIQHYARPMLAQALRRIAAQGNDIARQARELNVKPALLFYLALAETHGGQTGDPLATARQALPRLHQLRVDFGGDAGDSSLLIVAAYQAPLEMSAITSAQTDRNVWYLHDHKALSEDAYDFVLRFLAYGVIAQNPSKFRLDVPALVL